eukprot:8503497-Pyramimonas_sp.AAC.1
MSSSNTAQVVPTCADGAGANSVVAVEERRDTGGGATVQDILAKRPNESTLLELVRPAVSEEDLAA